jgi:hypothetical protein
MLFRNVATSLIGFGLTAGFAIAQKWSLQEFCWSTWLAGLVYSWACVASAAVQIVLTARAEKQAYDTRMPFLRSIPADRFLLLIIPAVILASSIAFYIYSWLFGFYGLFLSFFAEMEPHSLFGRNGFINSDFFTPVVYLFENFWPMIIGMLIANADDFLQKDAWKRIVHPFESEVLRIHVFILALPFLTLIAWAVFGTAYQPVTIILLLGLFYLMPLKRSDGDSRKKS